MLVRQTKILFLFVLYCAMFPIPCEAFTDGEKETSPTQAVAEALTAFPDFALTDQRDRLWTSEDLKGHFTYIDFWASWCKPCALSMPWLSRLHTELAASNFQILAINLDRKKAKAERFLQSYDLPFPVLFDSKGVLAAELKLPAMPSSFFVNPAGHILFTEVGWSEDQAQQVQKKIAEILDADFQPFHDGSKP
jgi:cytochrome c biogenesis protein CcmG, thiol:disulfide interchange protein DsbE